MSEFLFIVICQRCFVMQMNLISACRNQQLNKISAVCIRMNYKLSVDGQQTFDMKTIQITVK